MPAIRGLTVSVGYAEVLAITLPRNMRHLTECVVITSPEDHATQAVAASVPGVRLSITDSFARHRPPGYDGPLFNKGLAIEQGGFDFMGREGWIAIWDADCLWPDAIPLESLDPDGIHGMKRRVLADPTQWHPGFNWRQAPYSHDGGPIGFFQLVHADASPLRGKAPWYNVNYPHAGGGDAYFLSHFPRSRRRMLKAECLHLGPTDTNWWGTDPEGRRMAAAYFHGQGWTRAKRKHDPALAATVGELPERVEVPGYAMSDYEMPFERRAAARAR